MDISTQTAFHLVVLVLASAAHHISSTPPRIAQVSTDHLLLSKDEKKAKEVANGNAAEKLHGNRRFNRLGMACVAGTKYAVWSIISLEVVARLASLYPSSVLSSALLPILLPARTSHILHTPPSVTLILCMLSITIGYIIRRECFNAMGRLFSFTHTTLSTHVLITRGPYSVVRHPSYTGELLVRGGTAALLLRPGGFVAECGALALQGIAPSSATAQLRLTFAQTILLSSVRATLGFYVAWIAFACTFLLLRAPREDETLHAKFGKEWEAYAKRVPWRFVPYLA